MTSAEIRAAMLQTDHPRRSQAHIRHTRAMTYDNGPTLPTAGVDTVPTLLDGRDAVIRVHVNDMAWLACRRRGLFDLDQIQVEPRARGRLLTGPARHLEEQARQMGLIADAMAHGSKLQRAIHAAAAAIHAQTQSQRRSSR